MRERVELQFIEMNAVCENHVRTGYAERVQVSNIAHAGFSFDELAFVLVFGSMRVNHHAMFLCQLGNLTQQLPRAADREARCETTTNAPISCAVPFLN